MSELTTSPAWRRLQTLKPVDLVAAFAADPARARTFSSEAVGIYLDYSRQRIDAEILQALLALAQQQDLSGWIARMFAGEAINHTEQRAVLHIALRAPRETQLRVAGEDVVPAVHAVLDRMAAFAEQVRSGHWLGASGKPIRDVVNIGIGGSDLGPRMVCDALADVADGPRMHFVANVDGAQLGSVLKQLDPATSLFVVASKTFTTQETMANAGNARRWLVAALGEVAVQRHFVAVSTNAGAVHDFGIAAANMFEFWDWVGGRYSLWSAVGLPIMLSLGSARHAQLLAGAHAMDRHFAEAPLAGNLPVLMGLLAIWNQNFVGAASQVVAPYAHRLDKFVSWLQQLEMESNGKRVNRAGVAVDYPTTPAIWGDVGSNSQHAFFQMLHQGTGIHPVDFILPVAAGHLLVEQHQMLIANCLAQSAALMKGKTADQVRSELQSRGLVGAELEAAIPHRVFPGNRPSSTLLLPRLDAFHLGALLALYEHRTFVMSVIWDINAFDQWGVELGKQLAQNLLRVMRGESLAVDASTTELLKRCKSQA